MSGQTVQERGRAKALRPLPTAERRAALVAGLAAYDRGDYFLAHELLEPAWMGAADPTERALHSGLIKLAAAGVHGARGNPPGVAKNLAGARDRLRALIGELAADLAVLGPAATDLDLDRLVAAIDARLSGSTTAPAAGDPLPIPRRGR
jgi:hypothetical protein